MADPLTRLRDRLADRYVVERELGRGGMATVYLATDRKHHRSVAIKVLDHHLAASLGAPGTERFLREIQTAARLQHPNILTLHDSGEVDGSLYYVMPYVDGESLRNRLDREKRLPLEDAIRITRELAAGLTYAHARGVVHRDIKPENILFATPTPGDPPHALISDFGIARASTTNGGTLTQTGMSLGTPSYMSPEQASGESRIDGRSDTYSLGCVLYEMLGGHPPFLGTTTQEILARHLRDPVPPLRTIRPDIPDTVERAVGKALAKVPEDRYATPVDFATALMRTPEGARPRRSWPWLIATVALLTVVAAGYGFTRWLNRTRPSGIAANESVPSIAVLPFENVNGDSANAPFSDGVADELTTALGRVGELNVVARASAFSFRRSGLDARGIGRRLGVRYVVEGRVRSADQRRRVSAELIDVTTGNEIWSDTFNGDVGSADVFTIQDSITRSIVRQVLPRIAGRSLIAGRRPTESGVAHDLYLQGRYFFERRDSASLAKAQDYFRQAITSDSTYALAYAGLSDAYSHQSVFGFADPGVNFPKAREYAQRAQALDSSLVEVHTSLGFIALFYDWDYAAAGRSFAKAIGVDPRYAPAHLFRAWYLVAVDSTTAAVAEARLALSLDPFSSVISTRLVTFLYMSRRFEEAVEQANRTLERDSLFVGVRAELTRVLAFVGRCNEVFVHLNVPGFDQPVPQLVGIRGLVNAKCGRRAQAQAVLDSLRGRMREGKKVSHFGLAIIQAALGNNDEALTELELAREERAWPLFVLKQEPVFDPLRSDQRFIRLLRELKLIP